MTKGDLLYYVLTEDHTFLFKTLGHLQYGMDKAQQVTAMVYGSRRKIYFLKLIYPDFEGIEDLQLIEIRGKLPVFKEICDV